MVGPVRLADRIRDFIEEHYFAPARTKQSIHVVVSASELHRGMKLANRFSAVCSAMESRKLRKRSCVDIERWDGPKQGNAKVIYKFVKRESVGSPDIERFLPRNEVCWQQELSFELLDVKTTVPQEPGVYRFLQENE